MKRTHSNKLINHFGYFYIVTILALFSSNSFFASVHTREWGNSTKDGNKSRLNCSDASRGNNVGRWSIDITVISGFSSLVIHLSGPLWKKRTTTYPTSTATVGLENVVLILYIGIGLFGFVVSQLTSTTTESRRPFPALRICSLVIKWGIGDVK